MVGGALGHRDNQIKVFSVLGEVRREISTMFTLMVDGFFRSLVDRRGCADGQRSPGRLGILQGGNLQGGCSLVIKDELVGKRFVSLVLSCQR